jgi:hypothetical protein
MANAAPLVLTPEIAELFAGAVDSGNIPLVAAVDPTGKPLLSFRGSTSVYGPTQLGFWARNTAGGTLDAIKHNPSVAVMYRSQAVPMLQFSGRARITEDPTERDRVFTLSHERERQQDPARKGQAVIIDLDEISGVLGFGKDGPIFCKMKRE